MNRKLRVAYNFDHCKQAAVTFVVYTWA